MTTVASIVHEITIADRRVMRADYIHSTERRDRELIEASAQMRAARKLTVPHVPGDPCPVLPGTAVSVVYMGAMVFTEVPETLDWSQITEWKPIL